MSPEATSRHLAPSRISVLALVAMLLLAFVATWGVAAPGQAHATDHRASLEANYVKAQRAAGMDSFAGWCGLGVVYQIYTYGITEQREILGNGNQCADYFRYKDWTTGGYRVEYTRGSSSSGWRAFHQATNYGKLDGIYLASYVSATSVYGHVNFFIIDNEMVYIIETFRFNGVPQGTCLALTAQQFEEQWTPRYRNVLGVVRFSKEAHVHHYQQTGCNPAGFNRHKVAESCSCGHARTLTQECRFGTTRTANAHVCAECGQQAGPYDGNQVVELPEGTYQIQPSSAASLQVEVAAGDPTAGSNIQLGKAVKNTAQQFAFSKNSDGTYAISSCINPARPSLVGLAAASSAAGTNVQMTSSSAKDATNRWYVEKARDGSYALRNAYSNRYLGQSVAGKPASGQNIHQGSDPASAQARYRLVPVSGEAANGAGGASTGQAATPAQPPAQVWQRLSGQVYANTMQAIVQNSRGWPDRWGGTVVLATASGYWDALSASGVAGLFGAPVLITPGDALSVQAKEELLRLNPRRVIIAGGTAAISPAVEDAVRAACNAKVARYYGANATATAAKLATRFFPAGTATDNTAIVATSQGFYDALSASPVAYAKHYPIFLTDSVDIIAPRTVNAMKKCGITKVIVVGGKAAVGNDVVNTLAENGIGLVARLAGRDCYGTSRAIAEWGLAHGMSANGMGVATANSYYDALCGAALCGRGNSVMVLADERNAANTRLVTTHSKNIARGYIFGGSMAVPTALQDTVEKAVNPQRFSLSANAGTSSRLGI